jgi:hypothetical protein
VELAIQCECGAITHTRFVQIQDAIVPGETCMLTEVLVWALVLRQKPKEVIEIYATEQSADGTPWRPGERSLS